MRDAETTLAIIRERGKKGLHLEDVYRQLFNPDLYLRAYGRIYENAGAMTRGATEETVDGMSMGKIQSIIETLRRRALPMDPRPTHAHPEERTGRCGRSASRRGRTSCCKKSCAPSWRRTTSRSSATTPTASARSSGVTPPCRTSPSYWTGTKWFIEGDIKGCFDNIDHTVLLSILREKIHDNRFLILVENLLKAGYLEQWDYRPTLSGTPQGGIVSPLLANIYLDRLDKFVETDAHPRVHEGRAEATQPGVRSAVVHESEARKEKGASEGDLRPLRPELRCLGMNDQFDPDYRRLRVRPVRRRLPARLRRTEGRSRGDQGPAGDVPARSPQAGTLARRRP